MATNPLIALQGTSLNTAPAVANLTNTIQNKRSLDQRQESIDIQKRVAETGIAKERMQETAQYAVGLKSLLEKGDFKGAENSLLKRNTEIGARIQNGERIDNTDTLGALDLLQSGDIGTLINEVDAIVSGATRAGIISAEPETFREVLDDKGNIIGQRSSATNQVVADPRAPKAETTSEAERLARDILGKGATDAQVAQKAIEINNRKASSGANKTTLEIFNEAEAEGLSEEQKALGKSRVKNLEAIQTEALEAEAQNEVLSTISNIDVSQGVGVEVQSAAARALNFVGVDGNELLDIDPTNVQAFNAVAGKLVLDVKSTQKGPQTESDQVIIESTVPKITNEADANEFIINSLQSYNDRKIEQRDFYERHLEKNRTLSGADRAWSKFKRETPLLSNKVPDPDTGLPMFFRQFKEKAKVNNQNATDEQIIEAWRGLTK